MDYAGSFFLPFLSFPTAFEAIVEEHGDSVKALKLHCRSLLSGTDAAGPSIYRTPGCQLLVVESIGDSKMALPASLVRKDGGFAKSGHALFCS